VAVSAAETGLTMTSLVTTTADAAGIVVLAGPGFESGTSTASCLMPVSWFVHGWWSRDSEWFGLKIEHGSCFKHRWQISLSCTQFWTRCNCRLGVSPHRTPHLRCPLAMAARLRHPATRWRAPTTRRQRQPRAKIVQCLADWPTAKPSRPTRSPDASGPCSAEFSACRPFCPGARQTRCSELRMCEYIMLYNPLLIKAASNSPFNISCETAQSMYL